MSKTRGSKPSPCIERHARFGGQVHQYSVFEYVESMRSGSSLTSSKARAFHRVIWTEAAPEVHELTIEGEQTKEGLFRVSDRALYDEQMRQLLGIEPRPENVGWIV